MTTAAAVQVESHRSPYQADGVGGALLARLGGGDPPSGFPLFDPAKPVWRDDPPALDRGAMTDALAAYNRSIGNELAEHTLGALRTNARLIVTGQQPGLLLGPLLAAFKAITTLKLALQLNSDERPVLPMFWLASEDHDLAEVNHAYVGSSRFEADHDGLQNAARRPPVAHVPLVHQRDRLLGWLNETLPPTPHKAEAIDAVAGASFDNYASFFATLFARLLGPGRFILIDPMQVRPLLSPALARVVDHWAEAEAAFERGTQQLVAAGFPPQLDRLTVFEIVDGVRRPAEHITGERVIAEPRRFSPGAGVRPIVADAALPVLAKVGGPSELVYLWQIDPVYEAVGAAAAALRPRCTATIVTPREVELGERFGLSPAALVDAPRLRDQLAAGASPSELDDARDRLIAELDKLDDGRNVKLFDRARRSVRYHVDRIARRVELDRLNDAGRGEQALAALVEAIEPGGVPQERRVTLVELIARHGMSVVDRLIDACDPSDIAHRVIECKR